MMKKKKTMMKKKRMKQRTKNNSMKKTIFLLLLVICLKNGSAQNSNLVGAWNYLGFNEIDKAKTAIDAASVHEKTSGLAKTWYYKGLIYEKIYKNSNPTFAALDSNALLKAYSFYEKSLKIDPKSEFAEDIWHAKSNMYGLLFNKGVEEFKAAKFQMATQSFEAAMELNPKDTIALLNAATASYRASDKVKSKKYFSELANRKYKDPLIYSFLSEIYKAEKDTAKALSIVQEGRKLFPKNQSLVLNELNIYLHQGKHKLAEEQFMAAIENDPANPNLYYNLGLVSEKTGNLEKAAESYKKAIELKPDFFDALYSIGAMYFNKGAEMANAANNIRPEKMKEFNLAKEKSNEEFAKALPYLEKAYKIDPKDHNTLLSLKQLYVRLGNTEMYKKMKAELEKIGN
jgi:tetratricopeptide (TPR) repeat protein